MKERRNDGDVSVLEAESVRDEKYSLVGLPTNG
jgi:hypothetical protein